MKEYQIKPATILAGSGNIQFNSIPYYDENNTYVEGMSSGIWNRTNDPD